MSTRALQQTPQAPHTPSFWERATKFINPLVVRILNSEFHGLLSGRLLIVTVRGRKTGTRYSVPVEYHQELGDITVFSHQDRAWWRNLVGGADAMLHLRGFDVHAIGSVVQDRAEILEAAQTAFHLTPERAETFVKGKVLLHLRLSALPHTGSF